LLDEYNLLQMILPNMVINRNFVESNNPYVVIASLLKDAGHLDKVLNNAKYTGDDIKLIKFLVSLTRFDPKQVVELARNRKGSVADDDEIVEFSELNGLDMRVIETFLNFQLSVSGNEVMTNFGITGKAVGDKIAELEAKNFLNMLK
jgi:hypothetical protein